jgi:hypothetical protein
VLPGLAVVNFPTQALLHVDSESVLYAQMRDLGIAMLTGCGHDVTLRSQWRRFRCSVACSVTRTFAKHCATTSDPFFSLAGPLAFCGVFRSVFGWGALGTERAMLAVLPGLPCHGSCNGEGRWAGNVTITCQMEIPMFNLYVLFAFWR